MPERETTATIIGPGTKIKGELAFEGSARILGGVDGQINGTGELTIGSGRGPSARPRSRPTRSSSTGPSRGTWSRVSG